jgi:hypothetical protein
VLTLMVAQAFLFNAVFFTYGLVLTKAYHIADSSCRRLHPAARAGQSARPHAARPFVRHCGPPPHDRRHLWPAGLLLAATAWAFHAGLFTATTQTAAWIAIFFTASAAASRLPHRQRNIPAGNPRHGDCRCSTPSAR